MKGERTNPVSVSPRTLVQDDAVVKPIKRRKSKRKLKDVPCKNPECPNKLAGRQRDYCSRACSQKMYRQRETAKKKRAKKQS